MHYIPYFKSLQFKLGYLKIINEAFDRKIETIYNQLKLNNPKKYSSKICLYEETLKMVLEHNSRVRKIDEGMEGFDFEKILENPHSFNYCNISRYSEVAKQIKAFTVYGPPYNSFVAEVEEIKDNYSLIIEEFDAITEYNDLIKTISDQIFTDSKIKTQLLERRHSIHNKIQTHAKTYYKWGNDDEVIEAIKNSNEAFILKNQNDPLFDSINGKSLDKEQRRSVLIDETSTLVVAGAGSGKTLTICGKIEYLLKKCQIKPNEILLLSYSKKSAEDLQRKVDSIDNTLTVGTFHKIGLDILKETRNKVFMVEDQYNEIIESYFREELQKNSEIQRKILSYFGLYAFPEKHDKKYENKGELFEDLKKVEFTTLKNQLLSYSNNKIKKETIKKELVKSFQELAIANWYFINGIDYIYEAPYEVDVSSMNKRQYLPDFKLPQYHIYHEHYGINKNGTAEQFGEEEGKMYVESIEWKRNLHLQNQTDCIETYSYEFYDGTIFEKLEKELKSRGVQFKPLNQELISDTIESIYHGRSFKSFINLVRTFLSLYKSVYTNEEGFETLKNYKFPTPYQCKRAECFLDIVKDIYFYYMNHLRRDGKIDFDDMILLSMKELDRSNNFKYKYIVVDEFQDISISRMKFLKKLIQHGDAKLFAVGDDWQAIYRFSGCDLNVFLKFSDYFGESSISKITTTHRNSQELQNIAGPFIRANPEQFPKVINSNKHLKYPVQIMYYTNNKYQAFIDVLKAISKIDDKANVLILGRNNKDFEDIEFDYRVYIDYKNSTETNRIVKVREFPKMKFSFSTVHGSKGLEEDYVIIINADDNKLGFPNKMEDDVMLDMVLSSKSGYEYAEERRLWYVALTRTRNYTYIIADKENPSSFVKEIESKCFIMNPSSDQIEMNTVHCPHCKSGKLVLRENTRNGNVFYGCSNYPFCDYTINDITAVKRNLRCPLCGDILVFKRGKYGPFYGCHNYPECRYRKKYTPNEK